MGTIIRLKRKFNLATLTFYGVGNILGAGIYVLVGKVVEVSGQATLLAFLIASAVAALSAFSYMELSSRFPVSAGAAVYVHHAYKKRLLSVFVGICMVLSAIVSSAALARGFAGYFSQLVPLNETFVALTVVALMSAVAVWGIDATAKLATAFTLVEIAGLAVIIWFGRSLLSSGGISEPTLFSLSGVGISGVLLGAFLAFYAFIGFEDMVNVAEEVKGSRRTMPLAILFSLLISTTLYLLVVVVSTRAVPVAALAASESPLALVFTTVSSLNPTWLVLIGLAATVNGILVQITMASRMLYGMANKGWVNGKLAKVHVKTKTPVIATLLVTAVMLLAVATLQLVSLAKITSLLVLVVFTLINTSLLIVKKTHSRQRPTVKTPPIIPVLGTLSCVALIGYQLYIALN